MVSTALTTRRGVDAVVIGGSAGSVSALDAILPGLPPDYLPVLVVVHVPSNAPSLLSQLFASRCAMTVRDAESSEPIERGCIYFAPSDYHLLVEPDRRCALSIEPPVNFSRPAIDVLFESAAVAYGPRLAGVVLTGANADGAVGLRAIDAAGGVSVVQDPSTAESSTMPRAAVAAVPHARIVPLQNLLSELLTFAEVS